MADAVVAVAPERPAFRYAILVAAGLAIIYVVWGSAYVAVKIVVEDAPPLISMGARYIAAGGLLLVVAVGRRGWQSIRLTRDTFLGCLALAMLLPVLTNGTVAVAESVGLPAGPAALLSALTPISIVVLRVLSGDTPHALTLVGVVVGFAGLGVLLLGGHGGGGFPLGPSLIVILSVNCWAVGSYFQSRFALPPDSFATAAYELLIGGAILSVVAVASGEHITTHYETKTWLVTIYLTVSSMVAYTTYVWLIANAPISLVATFSYVNPVVAVFLGWLLLAEPITLTIVIGGAIVVLAVAIVISEERVNRLRSCPDAAPSGESGVGSRA